MPHMTTANTGPAATHPHADLIDAYLRHLGDIGRSPRTIRTYRHILTRAHRDLPYGLPLATTAELQAWLAGLRTAQARVTYRAAVQGFFRWAVERGHLDRDAAAGLPRARVPARLPRPCTDEQLATILARAAEPYRTWSVLAAYAGLRCIEIAQLRREDVTPESVTVHRGKGGKPRVVPTHPLVWQAVEPLPPGLVAGGRDAHYVSARLAEHYRSLGLAGVTAHRLRHWYGTTLVKSGSSIFEVRDLMGHASIATTSGYVMVASPTLRAAVGRLPALTTAGAA